VHERELPVPAPQAASLLDDPARMWPVDRWPAFGGDGFGFLRHELAEHRPGERIVFRITGPRGLRGTHGWDLSPEDGHSRLRHTVDAECTGLMRVAWPLVVQPIHEAVHEDVLDRAQAAVGGPAIEHPWSRRVRAVRWAVKKAGRTNG
jgi:hypothetical protein